MIEQESSGTNKLFDLAGYIVFTLYFGLQLIIDELDSKLHPILTQEIIKIFPTDGPAQFFLSLCLRYKDDPPGDPWPISRIDTK